VIDMPDLPFKERTEDQTFEAFERFDATTSSKYRPCARRPVPRVSPTWLRGHLSWLAPP